jgi:hypothetical protein
MVSGSINLGSNPSPGAMIGWRMVKEADTPIPREAFRAERSDWTDFGACVVSDICSPDDISAINEVLSADKNPGRSRILQDNKPLGFDRLHHIAVDKKTFLALPAWRRLEKSVFEITGVERDITWSGRSQHFLALEQPEELPHQDFAMHPGMISASVCLEGGIEVTVWPDDHGIEPTGPSKTFQVGVGDALLLDLAKEPVEPPYNQKFSWSVLHRFEVESGTNTSSVTVDFYKPRVDWTIPEEVAMSFLNDPGSW